MAWNPVDSRRVRGQDRGVTTPQRQIRAVYTAHTITVYQAYSKEIAEAALTAGRFVPPFNANRMTWIKPSFLWMMYRSGWSEKAGQECVLAIEITRAGFEWALARACLSAFDRQLHHDKSTWSRQLKGSPARVQWDPERSLHLAPLPYRSLQLGLSGEAVHRYVHEWIVAISDATPVVRATHARVSAGDAAVAAALLPDERPYPLPPDIGSIINASDP
jgi:hypothetical protein